MHLHRRVVAASSRLSSRHVRHELRRADATVYSRDARMLHRMYAAAASDFSGRGSRSAASSAWITRHPASSRPAILYNSNKDDFLVCSELFRAKAAGKDGIVVSFFHHEGCASAHGGTEGAPEANKNPQRRRRTCYFLLLETKENQQGEAGLLAGKEKRVFAGYGLDTSAGGGGLLRGVVVILLLLSLLSLFFPLLECFFILAALSRERRVLQIRPSDVRRFGSKEGQKKKKTNTIPPKRKTPNPTTHKCDRGKNGARAVQQ